MLCGWNAVLALLFARSRLWNFILRQVFCVFIPFTIAQVSEMLYKLLLYWPKSKWWDLHCWVEFLQCNHCSTSLHFWPKHLHNCMRLTTIFNIKKAFFFFSPHEQNRPDNIYCWTYGNLSLCSFLVGEGACKWAKSKDIALPPSIEEANEVIFFTYDLNSAVELVIEYVIPP